MTTTPTTQATKTAARATFPAVLADLDEDGALRPGSSLKPKY